MRSTLRWLLPALLALSIAGCKDDETKVQRVVVLFTTDEHSHLFAVAPEADDFPLPATAGTGALVGGVARRLTILQAERAAAAARGADTITLSSGDFSQGTLASAAFLATSPELRMMSLLGYDAVSLGNHEFDLSPRALAGAIGAAATAGQLPPLVLTNLYFSDTSTADDELEAVYDAGLIAPSRVITTDQGLRIGIVASLGVRAGTVAGGAAPVTFWSSLATTNEQKFGSIAAAVQGAVNALRAGEGVDAVILLAHGGIGATPGTPGEDETLAGALTGIDLVVSGHTHLFTPAPRFVYAPGGKAVPVVQTKPYGRAVGKVELVFTDDGSPVPYLDPAGSELIDVDDRVLPTTDAAFLGDLYALTMGYLESGNPAAPADPSFLEETLSTVLGIPVTDDAGVLGDLYFYPLCETDFPVIGIAPGETNAMNLDTDAMMAAAGGTAVVALQASGPIRGDLLPGRTNAITFADLYRLVPLGADPTANPLTDPNDFPGFPLVRAIVPTAALRAVMETLLQTSLLDGDFFPGLAGLEVRYDMSRTAFITKVEGAPADDTLAESECRSLLEGVPLPVGTEGLCPGWITYVGLANGTPLYDVSLPFPHFAVDPTTSALPTVTTLYIASFAAAFNVPLYAFPPTDPPQLTTPTDAILRRGDGSAVKDHESLATYVWDECAANGGFLPSRYDATTTEGALPRRMKNCTGGCI
jgi:5'-nucleotidase